MINDINSQFKQLYCHHFINVCTNLIVSIHFYLKVGTSTKDELNKFFIHVDLEKN